MPMSNFSIFFQDVISVRELHVDSVGGRVLITAHHLEITADYNAHGIKESAVLFHVLEFPKHGRLDVTFWERDDDNIFTLLDLNTDKVHYISDRDSSDTSDSVVFEIEFASSFNAPSAAGGDRLLRRHRFVLHISISGGTGTEFDKMVHSST